VRNVIKAQKRAIRTPVSMDSKSCMFIVLKKEAFWIEDNFSDGRQQNTWYVNRRIENLGLDQSGVLSVHVLHSGLLIGNLEGDVL